MYTHHFRIFDLLPTEMPFPASADIMGTTTSPRQNVTIKINGTTYTVKSDSQGRFYFNVPSGTTVTSLYQMCKDQTAIATIDVTGLDTSSCTDMSEMFRGCTGLTSVDVTGLDTDSVTTFTNMFNGCTSLTTITGIKGFDTGSALYMNQMFYNCSSLTSLDLAGWDTDQVTGMSSMFYGCSGLTSLDLRTFDTTGVMTSGNWTYIVPNSSSLTVTYKPSLFSSTIRSTYANVNWVALTGNKITGTTTSPSQSLTFKINGSNVSVSSNSNSKFTIYTDGINITSLSHFSGASANAKKIATLDFDCDTSSCTDMSMMFWNCTNLMHITFTNFDTSNVTTMEGMFNYVHTDVLDISSFDTSKVTNMKSMFEYVNAYRIEGISSLNTSNVTTMERMFCEFNMSNVGNLDLSGFDTSNVTTMNGMFNSCLSSSIDVSSFDTRKVTDMSGMFIHCYGLTSIDISSFDTPVVTDISDMFDDCPYLTYINASSMDTTNVSSYTYFVANSNTLTVKYGSKFSSTIRNHFSSVNWVAA